MDHIFLFLFFPLLVKPEHKASFCLKDSVHQLPAFVKASRKLIGYRMRRPMEKKRWFQARNLGNPATLLKLAAWLANFRPDRTGYLCHLANVPNQRCWLLSETTCRFYATSANIWHFSSAVERRRSPRMIATHIWKWLGYTRGDGTLWGLTLSLKVRRRRLSLLTQKSRKIKKKKKRKFHFLLEPW